MKNVIKRFSVWANIVGVIAAMAAFLPALVPMFEGESIKDNPKHQAEIILGFAILSITAAISTIMQQSEIARGMEDAQSEIARSIVDAKSEIVRSMGDEHGELRNDLEQLTSELDLYTQVYRDELRRNIYERISLHYDKSRTNAHVEDALTRVVSDRADGTFIQINASRLKSYYGMVEEKDRLRRLVPIIESATEHVYAVTLDLGNYINELWAGDFATDYLVANSRQALRVQRIFVLSKGTIDGTDRTRHEILDRVFAEHTRFNLKYHIVERECLRGDLKKNDTGFLVCDGIVASESYSLADGGKRPGYIVYNDLEAARQLKKLFVDLNGYNKVTWVSRSSKNATP